MEAMRCLKRPSDGALSSTIVSTRALIWPTLFVAVVSLVCSAAALGSSARGRFDGTVQICPPVTGGCSLLAASVTVYRVEGQGRRGAVTTKSAPHGRFSFELAPGRYIAFPTNPIEHDRCISSEVRVRAGKNVSAIVRCYPRIRQGS
jgi:hypothetical protein